VDGDTPQAPVPRLHPGFVELRRRHDRAAVVVDFDGTLAPIVDDPAIARPLPGTLPVLRALVRRFRLVAVVSGRPAAFLATHLDVDGLVRVGSYGLEEVTPTGIVQASEASAWTEAVRMVTARAREHAPPGVLVEDKGLSITLHYRTAPGVEAWIREFARAESSATGLVAHDARRSVELRPPLAGDKGGAVARLVERDGVDAACVCGDDIGDLPAFAAVDALDLAVRVAVRSDEIPASLVDAADVVVDGPDDVLEVLRYLAG